MHRLLINLFTFCIIGGVACSSELDLVAWDDGRNGHQLRDETVYWSDAKKSYTKSTVNGNELSFEMFIHGDESQAPPFRGTVKDIDSWMLLEFDFFDQTGAASLDRTFDPYGTSRHVPNHMMGSHVLPPDNGFSWPYEFELEFSCSRTELIGPPDNRIQWQIFIPCETDSMLNFTVTLTDIEQPIPGDANFDGEVTFADFLILQTNFGDWVANSWFEGDFGADGIVHFQDFLMLSDNFGRTGGPVMPERGMPVAAPVPEPSTALLASIAMLVCLSIRRRRS